MARSVEWKVLFSNVTKDETGTYGLRDPKLGPNSATNHGGSAGSIYMGTQDVFLTGGQGDAVEGLTVPEIKWYKSAPVRIPAGAPDKDVNYSFEKFVALRFVDPGDVPPTTITNMHVWKNAGSLQAGVAVFAALTDRENGMDDGTTSRYPLLPESSVAFGARNPLATQVDYEAVVAEMKAELPSHTVTDTGATSGWKLFAAPLFESADPAECVDKESALVLSDPDMVAETDWDINGTTYGKGYTNELLVFTMAVMAGCSTPGDIQTQGTPITIMVEYNES